MIDVGDRVLGFISGGLSTSPSDAQILAVHCAVLPSRLANVVAAVAPGTPTTPTDCVLDVRKNGSSVWSNAARRPTLPASSSARVFTTYQPDNAAVAPGDIVTLVCVQAAAKTNVALTVALLEP